MGFGSLEAKVSNQTVMFNVRDEIKSLTDA